MASSMVDAAVAASASASSAASAELRIEEEGCPEGGGEEALNSSLRCCANDPDFAVICAFLQKFSKDLGIVVPNIKHLQEWLTNTDQVSDQLRDLHIKLLRKTRKTVHEKSWESALSKFCFTYSAQDAWEIERFGYKNSSLKVKLRIFRELLESQFQRNGKFRAQILTMSADSLRSQPIGRDRLGHAYYFTQDADCNLRIYQEHLDEEIWQVVATTRDELVNLISRLRGNEVVLPSTDIGVDEDTSSSNSCTAQADKPPPPEEQDDSQEEEARVPNLRIKLSHNGKLTVSSPTISGVAMKRCLDDVDQSSPQSEELNILKKSRPSLLDVNRTKKPSRYEKTKSEEEDDEEDEEELSLEEEDIDSAAAEEDENEEKEIEYSDGDDDVENEVGEAIEDPAIIIHGEGGGRDCEGDNTNTNIFTKFELFCGFCYDSGNESPEPCFSETVEDETLYIFGEGTGFGCLVGNTKHDAEDPTTTTLPPTAEPKATFFFGEPGCLKLSPIKQTPMFEGKVESSVVTEQLATQEKGVEKENDIITEKSEEQTVEDHVSEKNIFEDKQEEENSGGACGNQSENVEKLINSDGMVRTTSNGDGADCNKEPQMETVKELEKSDENENGEISDGPNVSIITNEGKNIVTVDKSDETSQRSKDEQTKANENELDAKEKSNESGADVATSLAESIKEVNVCSDKGFGEEDPTLQQQPKDELNEENISDIPISGSKIVDNVDGNIIISPAVGIISENMNCEVKEMVKSAELKMIEYKTITKSPTRITDQNIINEKLIGPNVDSVEQKSVHDTSKPSVLNPLPPARKVAATSVVNRKRRLDDMPAPTVNRLSTSESEVDFHSEHHEEAATEDDIDPADVGGKRFKMRPKITNTELRKKVEAQKVHVEETSSSGEEDARRRRKIIAPRRQIERCVKNLKVAHEAAARKESGEAQSTEKSDSIIPNVEDTSTELDVKSPPAVTLAMFKATTSPFVTSAPILLAPLTTTTATVVRQKPTLAEIIEKKLKKTPEKAAIMTRSEIPATGADGNALVSFSPPKKSPITKPLKKNLLTQIYQEESDEDSIPRKRTISDGAASAVPTESVKMEELINTEEKKKTSEFKPPERKASERKAAERKTAEGQRKRRSSEEEKPAGVSEPESNKEMKYDSEVKQDLPIEMVIKKGKSPSPSEPAIVTPEFVAVGRRSSRRSAAAVIYSELPQPKRTRAGAKIVATLKKEPAKEEKTNDATKKTENTVVVNENKPSSLPKDANKEDKRPKPAAKATKAPKKDTKKGATTLIKEEPKEAVQKDAAVSPVIAKSQAIPSAATPPTSTLPVAVTEKNTAANTPATNRVRVVRKKREVDTTNIIESTDSEIPVRQSRRIAQQKIREEAERRKLEEIALRTMKQELKKKKKAEKQSDPTVVEPTEPSSSEESEVELKKKTKKRCPGKDGWSSGSEEQEEPEEDDEPPHEESDPGSPLFRSDHEFSPESDLEDETQVVPMKRARTARKEDAEEGDDGDEEACQKCGKSDHPEWILLCDNCDKGYHCSCLSPVLFYIPEGDWYCPPCQQEQLIAALEKQLNDFDEFVEQKRLQEEENKRLAAEAERAEQERLENEKQQLIERKKRKKNNRRRGESGKEGQEGDESAATGTSDDDDNSKERRKKRGTSNSDEDSDDDKPLVKKGSGSRKSRVEDYRDSHKRRRGDGRSRRRAARRGIASRRRQRHDTDSGTGSGSLHRSGTDSGGASGSGTSSSSVTDSDDEPIYKLRKRRQINVSYRLNEYDDLINSALKKEMAELAGAGNLGRGKDISTIIEADKEEKARQRHLEKDDTAETDKMKAADKTDGPDKETQQNNEERVNSDAGEDSDEVLKRKAKPKSTTKKKSRKLTMLDISSEEDNASDEDFKTSSFEDEEDEDTSISLSTDSDSSLEIFRRRGKNSKKQRKAARRAARERRKDRRFVVNESDDDDEEDRPKSKKKRDDDWDSSESETDSDASENVEDVDSADLCDDTTSESDCAWYPSKRKKQGKGNSSVVARKSPKMKKLPAKKAKRVEYSDDDISESEEEDDDDDDFGGGKGSGKQPRSQPLKPSNSTKGKGKGKGKGKTTTSKKKKKISDEDNSFSDSEDSTRRTRGRRYAYLEDFDDESSDGGIKPGVQRPDTPPEERQKFIQRQEEIKRMLAEKNAEGAKLAATPRLTPIKAAGEKDKRSPTKLGDSLSTVPLSVIRQAKVLDADYLQRKGECVGDSDNVDEVDEFDDADLPDDFPEDMDEDTIARMVEEEEELTAAAAARDLPAPDDVVRTPAKSKPKEALVAAAAAGHTVTAVVSNLTTNANAAVLNVASSEKSSLMNPSLAALSQMPGATMASGPPHMTSMSGLQEPMRKRLPMPTLHPPLLRHQFPSHGATMPLTHLLHRHPSAPPATHLLQSALNTPLGQPLNRNSFPPQHLPRLPAGMSLEHVLAAQHLMSPAARHSLPPTTQPLPVAAATRDAGVSIGIGANSVEPEPKPRGRRKKITPLRDSLQKQQTAAAVTAATAQSEKPTESAGNTSGGSVIKSVATVTAPPTQMYKSPNGAGGPNTGPGAVTQPSVITRMSQLPTSVAHASVVRAMSNLYPGADVARFFASPQSVVTSALSAVSGVTRSTPAIQRIREASGMSGLPPPPHGANLRQSYGPPPPLRGNAAALANHSQPQQVGSVERPTYPSPAEHHVPSGMSASIYGGPPPARHSASHLNPYRPPIYGNPNFVPRGPAVPNLRVPVTSGTEFASGARTYSPYGYYPPPPPLTTPHVPSLQRPPTTSVAVSVPASVSVSGPGSVSVPIAPTTAPTTRASASTSATVTTPTAKPSSVIVSAPSSIVNSNLNVNVNAVPNTALKSPILTSTPASLPTSTVNRAIITEVTVTVPPAEILSTKASAVTVAVAEQAMAAVTEPRKKLTTLETYAATHMKSPLVIAGESSGSRSSPGGIQGDGAEDSSSAQGTSTAAVTIGIGEGQASEFSGLVSYFSSQHDDYNT